MDHHVPKVSSATNDIRTLQWYERNIHANEVNARKRNTIRYEAMTEAYAICYAACERTNPKLAWDLSVECALADALSNYMDGELAWAMIKD